MSADYEGMSEAEAMAELARLMWERYMKPRASEELLNHSLDGYKAQVYSNNEDGTLTVIRPFDNTTMTLRCPPALAESAQAGDQVLVIQLGDASNSFILCGTDMSGFGEGGIGQFRPVSFDFSTIGDGYFTEVVEDKDGNQVTTIYDVTFDLNGRIDSVTSRMDNWQTDVEWGTYERLPAADVGFDPTGTTLQSNTVQGAIVEVANGGGGGGGSGASETIIATVEASTTASKNYAVKDYLIMSGVLYRVTSPISSGATITIGTNVTPAVLGNDVAAHIQNTSNPHQVTAAQAGAMPSTATLDDIPNGTTYAKPTAAQVAQIGTNQTAISAIEGKIPSAASPLNQLADKDFVTDSITQGTAIFRGSFATRAALLAVQWQTTNPSGANYVSNNDYAVVLDDETQNDECWRYIYVTGTGWTPQYRINESPLTQAQLDALNSGATAAIISSVGDKLDKTGDGKDVTATFTAASTRANISTGEKLSVMFGKIAKWFADLGTAAFAAISTSTPQMDGTGAAGSTGQVSDAGHTHPSDTSRVPVYGMGENLLDNADFRNPINQRGASSYTATGNYNYYSIDRWYLYGASRSLTIGTGYVTITPPSGATASLTQRPQLRYSDVAGTQMTISALLSSGELLAATNTIPANAPSSNTSLISAYSTVSGFVRLGYNNGFYYLFQTGTGTSLSVVKAKLEPGTEQTLCHNEGTDENPVWVPNEIPDYEAELIKCQTSTADPSDTYANKSLATEQQIAYVETGTTASRAYSVGEYFCWNGLLYRVTSAISSGGTITPGTNCEQATVGSILTGTSVSSSAIGMPGIAVSRVRAGIVFLNVYDFKPSSASGTISGTLPQELRPIQTTSGMVLSADGTKFARISISTQGVVTYTGVDTSRYYYGLISYPAAI